MDETISLEVPISDELYAKLEKHAATRGLSVDEFVNQFLASFQVPDLEHIV